MRVLSEPEAKRILSQAGVCVPPGAVSGSLEEALDVAREVGYPIVLKAVSPDILHKTEAGAVVLNLSGPEALAEAYRRLIDRLRARPVVNFAEVLVERMMPSGTEMIIGARRDPQFGPVIMVGSGGIFVEVLRDVACRVAPVDRTDAKEMWQELRAAPILTGARGQEPLDTDSLEELLVTVSRLATNHGGLIEMDLNPVLLYPTGVVVVDARILVEGPEVTL
jgi:acyl-CoA synthetase (NDP forming)